MVRRKTVLERLVGVPIHEWPNEKLIDFLREHRATLDKARTSRSKKRPADEIEVELDLDD